MADHPAGAGRAPTPGSVSTAPARTAFETLASLGSSPAGLSATEAASRLTRLGPNEVVEPPSHPLRRLARKFWGLSAWMIELIVALSVALGKWVDAAVAVALLLMNALLAFAQEQRASSALTALRHRLPVTARVIRAGAWQVVPARELVPGDVVRVRAGDLVPADLQVLEGVLHVDQSTLTGESAEVQRQVDGQAFAGSSVRRGEATAVVTATGAASYFGRTTELVATAQPRLHVDEVVSRLVRWLLAIVGALVTVTVVAALTEGLPLLDIAPLSLVLLMGAVPVALPVMFTVSMAIGSMDLARRGALVTRLSAIEDAAHMDVLCADKTGTLTLNRLALVGSLPAPGFAESDVLLDGALASNEANADPIDLAFLQAARERSLTTHGMRTVSFLPFSPERRSTEAVIEEDGRRRTVVKGAIRTVGERARLTAPEIETLEATASAQAQSGARVLATARADGDGPLRLSGLALLADPLRPDSGRLVEALKALGVEVKMLTGDALPVARATARELGLGEVIRAADLRPKSPQESVSPLFAQVGGLAEIFPEDKYGIVKDLQAAGRIVGMTGDGVNDAPALRQAEVGIAVSGATDVAKGAASVVLTTEGLASMVDLVQGGRAIYQRVLTWIINKVSRTLFKTGFVVIAFLVTGQFVISALGMVLLVFMTDFVKIALSTDNVRPSMTPERWSIGPLVRVALLIGLLMLVEALGLLAFGWTRLGLDGDLGRLQTFSFQVMLFFALFSIVSIRERRAFWSSRPSTTLAIALGADALVGVAIGLVGLGELSPLPLWQSLVILGYAAVCGLGPNDLVKTVVIGRSTRSRH